MSKHTPGPWQIEDRASYGLQIYGPGGTFGGGSSIATIRRQFGQSWNEPEANARLIAAAPELLAALKAYDDAMTSCWGEPEALPPGNPDAARCWPMARAAIAKATGDGE